MSEQSSVGRRHFMKSGLAAAAGTASLRYVEAQAAEPSEPKQRLGAMPTRPFGKTGRTLPLLGMGGSAMVDKWATSYGVTLASVDERPAMVRYAFDKGVRYFDTARVYGESESIVGKGLKDVRTDVFIATKVAVYSPEAVRRSLETSLEQLGMDYVDLAHITIPTLEAIGMRGAIKIHA